MFRHDSPQAHAAAAAGKPTSFEMPVGRAWLEGALSPDMARSIERHRVTLRRERTTTF
jgi:hypothetical protein